MYALVHDLARRRLLYRRPLATLPDLLLIDVPARFAHPSLPLGRYYPILIETDREASEVDAFLKAPRDGPVPPDLLDRRASNLTARRIIFAAYAPPAEGWPHMLVCHWPETYVALAVDPDMFARGAYTSEALDSNEALCAACFRLIDVLGEGADVELSMIRPDLAAGRA